MEPVIRTLTEDDAASNGSKFSFFHKDCWSLYKQYKANKRRRSSYWGLKPPQPPQPHVPLQPLADVLPLVVEDEPPELAIEDQHKDDEAEDKPPALAVEGQHTETETKDQPPEHATEEQHQDAEVDG